MATTPKVNYLKDYSVPSFVVDRIDLGFDIEDTHTCVYARALIQRHPQAIKQANLILSGSASLESLKLDGETLRPDQFCLEEVEERLSIFSVPDSFVLEIFTRLEPDANTSLMGLYASGGNLFTQCEPEGFRKITYYLDRPDVMTKFSTTIVADKQKYPVLLSNGNKVAEGMRDKKRHWVRWVDPYKKPSYLFALVAGKLTALRDYFVTQRGRQVALEVWTTAEDQPKAHHAMQSLKKAMRWDEERFGLEYDLDIYMVVAVGDFNMGAMENKGLNIFNTKYVLASTDTATDTDFRDIESVIGHEYFHNWTGNRVTCRDWFQLSLKEGLTVFRDQEFSADMGSRAVCRIEDVKALRMRQFPEDSGPTAHPIRPDHYIEINNFYTMTIYEKGAEVVRLYQTLLGVDGFRKGMELYFKRHDGQAVTCDDFRLAMAEANQVDLTQLARWYSQAGTPTLKISSDYEAATSRYSLLVEQSCAPTPGQEQKLPFLIPLALGLLDPTGKDYPLQLEGEDNAQAGTRVLKITEASQRFTFVAIPNLPVPSLLRGFSAPVHLEYDWTDDELLFLMAHDQDSFSRWEAGQNYVKRLMLAWLNAPTQEQALPAAFIEAFAAILQNLELDPAFKALMLTMPIEGEMLEWVAVADPERIQAVRHKMIDQLAQSLRSEWRAAFEANQTDCYVMEEAGKRRLKNLALMMLNHLPDAWAREAAISQFQQATSMTDQMGALLALRDCSGVEHDTCYEAFQQRWMKDPLVMDKYFGLIASGQHGDTLERVQKAMQHPAFSMKNPNKVRALIGTFGANVAHFHALDGRGYQFMVEQIMLLDPLNPQVASRLLTPFTRLQKLEPVRQRHMRTQLQRLLAVSLSKDSFEMISKILA